MHTILAILMVLALLALTFALFAVADSRRARGSIIATNVLGFGWHEGGKIGYKADAALTTRFLLAKIGSDANHVTYAGTSDIPIGVITDEAAAAEDLVNVRLLGSSNHATVPMVASAAITVGDMVVSAANGKIRTLPGTTGTYYIIGRALQAASADGDVIEVDPYPPIQRVVP